MPIIRAREGLTARQPRSAKHRSMIDKITILIPHLLMVVAIWRLLLRDDLDRDPLADPLAPQLLKKRKLPKRDMGSDA
jgi:hypothetical protein